jgi:hypothetical protein
MTNEAFEALRRILRLRSGCTLEAARLHLVHGIPVADAARAAGATYRLVFYAVKRAKAGMKLARLVCAGNRDA